MKSTALSALLCISAALSFFGCNRSTPTEPAQKTYKIGVSIPSADHGWTGGVVYHANQAKQAIESQNSNFRVLVSTAATSGEQVDRIENLLVQKIDALVVLPSEPAPLTPICEKAKQMGVKLIVVDRNLTKPIQDVLICGDNPGFGQASAELIANTLQGKGSIVIMEGIPCDVNSQRVNAFREVMKNYPEIQILESGAAEWNTEKGLKLMENFLQKYPALDAVWTGDDDVSIGALKAYEESGRTDLKILVGGGGAKAIVKRVLEGDALVKATVTYPPAMIAEGIQYAAKILQGNPPATNSIIVKADVVTPENAASFYFPNSSY